MADRRSILRTSARPRLTVAEKSKGMATSADPDPSQAERCPIATARSTSDTRQRRSTIPTVPSATSSPCRARIKRPGETHVEANETEGRYPVGEWLDKVIFPKNLESIEGGISTCYWMGLLIAATRP